ncbi:MAG: putative ABC transporter permease [Lachnospiraceae bacterium]|nr:putative ABC transporter permease [Lachnospiraceae bacterium]
MLHYTAVQWLFFFYFYCFFGWVFESAFVSVKSRHFVNRGFMRGPYLPIYGSGAIMMLVVSMPFQDNIFLTYIAGCIGATALELVTGITMEALFKVRYWDYSNQKFNYKGHICLSSTLAWGFLTILMTECVHRAVERAVFAIPGTLVVILTVIVSVCIVADFTLSFKAALDLRDILIGLEKAKEEMERIQKRLDVIIAVANDEWELRKLERESYVEELMDNLERRFVHIKERISIDPGAFVEDVREELMELRGKYLMEKEERMRFKHIKDFWQRNLIKGNPGMKSRRFEEALEELKKVVEEYRK